MAETNMMDRRGAIRALLGLVGVAAGVTALTVSGSAEAAPAPLPAAPLPEAPEAVDMASEDTLPKTDETQYYYYRRRPVYRRRVYYYRRPVRRYYYRRPVYRRRVVRRVYWY